MTTHNLPSPFSGPNFHLNMERAGAREPCVICGNGIKDPTKAPSFVIIDGGARFATAGEEYDPNAPGFMGSFPIGPECLRKHPALKAVLKNPPRVANGVSPPRKNA